MQDTVSFNDLYRQYTAGLLEKKKFEGMIIKIMLENNHRYHLYQRKKEDAGDYISWLYPRISKAIDTYRDIGSSFENYINSLIKWAAKEYRAREANNFVTEYAAWTAIYPDFYAREEEPEYGRKEAEQDPGLKPARNRRQLLFLVLKCYCYVSDDFLDRLAPALSIERDLLKTMIEQMKKQRLDRDREIALMRERVNRQFYRCVVYEKQLLAIPENSAFSIKMKLQLEKARIRLETMRKRLTGMRLDASNIQIAKVLGVSKGAVDSGLYILKKKWKINLDKVILN
jgi:hypothetical protein